MALGGDLAPLESAEEDVGEDPEHHLPWESSGGLNRALASSTLPSIATDNVLSGSKKELPVTAAEGAQPTSRPALGLHCLHLSQLLTDRGWKAKSPFSRCRGARQET